MSVYLLHFEQPYKQARHYLGYSKNVAQRLEQHLHGRGVPLMRAVHEAGIVWCLARTWEGDWGLEKYLRRQKNSPRFCPFCRHDQQHQHEVNMKKTTHGKPLTHCEKYGHTWAAGTSDGFDVCTHVSYVQGKAVRCQAVRRQPTRESRPVRTTLQHKASSSVVTQQTALWS